MKVSIPVNDLKLHACECTNLRWITSFQLRIIPPLYSQTGKSQYFMAPDGFLCTNCGKHIPLAPVEKEEPEKRIISA